MSLKPVGIVAALLLVVLGSPGGQLQPAVVGAPPVIRLNPFSETFENNIDQALADGYEVLGVDGSDTPSVWLTAPHAGADEARARIRRRLADIPAGTTTGTFRGSHSGSAIDLEVGSALTFSLQVGETTTTGKLGHAGPGRLVPVTRRPGVDAYDAVPSEIPLTFQSGRYTYRVGATTVTLSRVAD